MSRINENTFVSLSIVAAVALVIFSLGQSYSELNEHASKISEIEDSQKDTDKKLVLILQTLARIEERLAQSKK
jgi:hypothetical protein